MIKEGSPRCDWQVAELNGGHRATSNFPTDVRVCRPSECSDDRIREFERLVIEGGEVDDGGLRGRIHRAYWLTFVRNCGGFLTGAGALKQPGPNYKTSVFKKAGVPDEESEYHYELGWIVVEPNSQRQGLSRIIVRELLDQAGRHGVFATTREGNEPMARTNERFGMVRLGALFKGRDEKIQLWGKLGTTNQLHLSSE